MKIPPSGGIFITYPENSEITTISLNGQCLLMLARRRLKARFFQQSPHLQSIVHLDRASEATCCIVYPPLLPCSLRLNLRWAVVAPSQLTA